MMNSENEERPQYFANGDFEKTVADIISSPRRGTGIMLASEALFKITDKQRDYYLKCFKHLLKSTQGAVTDAASAALNGVDIQVQEFFKKSGLDNQSLSRIWALSDVNEDGWLDMHEFSTAMHLIVLRVKGEVPIPQALPEQFRPPWTPARMRQVSPAAAHSAPVVTHVSNSMGSWENFTYTDSPVEKQKSLTQFSDVPPLLVDRRPTAVMATPAPLLSLRSPSGPPPQPPLRPTNRGHGRSASLDFKVPQGFSTFATDRRDSDSSAMSSSVYNAPPLPLASRPTPSVSMPLVPPPIPARASPPIPARISPPVPARVSPAIPARTPSTSAPVTFNSIGVQTDRTELLDKELLDKLIAELGGKMEDLLGSEVAASQGTSVDRWGLRCQALREQNYELEVEKARLAQVRKQLELRVQEHQQSRGSTAKPTSL